MGCLISHSAGIGLNLYEHFGAAVKYHHYKSPDVQAFVISPATGGEIQRLKPDWLPKEESVFKHSIKSEGPCLGKAPMVSTTEGGFP